MLNYNNYDLESLDAVKTLCEEIGVYISDEDVFAKAKEENDIPCFENILIELTYSELEEKLVEVFGDAICISYDVNARTSSFNIRVDDENIEEIKCFSGRKLSLSLIKEAVAYSTFPDVSFELRDIYKDGLQSSALLVVDDEPETAKELLSLADNDYIRCNGSVYTKDYESDIVVEWGNKNSSTKLSVNKDGSSYGFGGASTSNGVDYWE